MSVAASRAWLRVSSLAATPRRRTLLLLAYGLVVGVITVSLIASVAPSAWPGLASRESEVVGSIEILEDGGPPLLGRVTDRSSDSFGQLYPVGVSDDQGIYLFVPLLAYGLGLEDPVDALTGLFLGLFLIPLVLYPLIFRALFDSTLAALVAPLGLALGIRFLDFSDVYWVPAWCAFTLLPAVFLIDRRWPSRAFLLLALVVFVASVATSLRSNAGLPILLAALLVVFARRRPWRLPRRLGAAVVLGLVYLSFSGLGLAAVREYRDSQVDQPNFGENTPSAHPFWHTAYIGLGYLPNDDRIWYRDEVALAAAKRERPSVLFLTDEYETTLRKLFFERITEAPGYYAIELTAKKTIVASFYAAIFLAFIAFFLPALALLERRGDRVRRYVFLALPAAIVTLGPVILAAPFRVYELGFFGALGLICLLGVGWIAAGAERLLRAGHPFSGLRSWLRELPGRPHFRPLLAVALVSFAVVVAAHEAAPSIEREATDWQARFRAALQDAPSSARTAARYPRSATLSGRQLASRPR